FNNHFSRFMKMKNLLSTLLLIVYCHVSFGQDWTEKMHDPHGNFYQIKADFESYWATHDNTQKGKGYKAFKRWENFVERRVYPSGDLAQLQLTPRNYENF